MKITVEELREMVCEAIGRTLNEAKKAGRKPKDIPERTVDSVLAQRDRHVRGMKGYAHSPQNDFSEPLGDANIVKRQGATGMGGWTAESVTKKIREMQLRKFLRIIVGEEIGKSRGI